MCCEEFFADDVERVAPRFDVNADTLVRVEGNGYMIVTMGNGDVEVATDYVGAAVGIVTDGCRWTENFAH